MSEADDQTGLASGSSLTWAHQEIALGIYGTKMPTPPRVALQGPCGAFPAINDQHAVMMLTWPWWSLEGSLLASGLRKATF